MKYMTVFLLMLVTICGCLPGGDILNQVSYEMENKFSEQVSVSILNNEELTISLINSKKNKLNDDEKGKYALEIALYVYNHLKSINNLKEISIKFIISSEVVIFYSRRTIASFTISLADLAYESQKRKNDGNAH